MIDYNYPDIFMGEAVQKNLLITDGTVTVSGDTYTVTGDTVTITNSELETEAFELHQSICSDMQLRFGSCESAYISFVFHADTPTLIGKVLKVYIIPNHEASKMLQLGVFKVQSDKVSYEEQRHVVKAYDAMYDILNKDVTDWYDTILQDEDATCTLDDLRYTFLNQFDIEVETRILPNDNIVLRRTIEPEMLSGADVIRAICEINGVFGMITNEGKFRYVPLYPNIREPLSPSSVYELPVSKYISINNDDYDSKEISGVRIITNEGSYTKTVPGIANNIYTISGNFLISDFKGTALQTLAQQLMITVSFHYYQPTVIEALGNPIIEPGDPIKVATKTGYVYTYALQRHMRGVQALRDTYTANGEEYANDSLNSSSSRFTQLSQQIAQATQAASVTADNNFVEIIRNIGFRLLDEPSNVNAYFDEVAEEVRIKWTDPADISSNEPAPAMWAGTVVVRKEGSAPRHRWDGVEIIDSTTRDEYSATALIDNTIDPQKSYYYGIFPYDTKGDYRFTKTVKIGGQTQPEPIYTEVVFFSNGTINQDLLPVGFDIDEYIDLRTSSTDPIDVSQYIGNSKCLLCGQYNNMPYTISNDLLIRSKPLNYLYISGTYLIPVSLNKKVKKIKAKQKILNTGDRLYPQAFLGGIILEGNQTRFATELWSWTDNQWHDCEYVFNEPIRIYYIILGGGSYEVEADNITILYET